MNYQNSISATYVSPAQAGSRAPCGIKAAANTPAALRGGLTTAACHSLLYEERHSKTLHLIINHQDLWQ